MPQKFAGIEKIRTFATAKPKRAASLGYGVMVTLQILVLSFLVRIQVAQQKKRKSSCRGLPFLLLAIALSSPLDSAITRRR